MRFRFFLWFLLLYAVRAQRPMGRGPRKMERGRRVVSATTHERPKFFFVPVVVGEEPPMLRVSRYFTASELADYRDGVLPLTVCQFIRDERPPLCVDVQPYVENTTWFGKAEFMVDEELYRTAGEKNLTLFVATLTESVYPVVFSIGACGEDCSISCEDVCASKGVCDTGYGTCNCTVENVYGPKCQSETEYGLFMNQELFSVENSTTDGTEEYFYDVVDEVPANNTHNTKTEAGEYVVTVVVFCVIGGVLLIVIIALSVYIIVLHVRSKKRGARLQGAAPNDDQLEMDTVGGNKIVFLRRPDDATETEDTGQYVVYYPKVVADSTRPEALQQPSPLNIEGNTIPATLVIQLPPAPRLFPDSN